MSSELDNALGELESWVEKDPRHLLEYILGEQGFSSFWQMLVAAAYEESPLLWPRLELAAQRLSHTETSQLRDRLVERLLDKAEIVCGITNEQALFTKVRSFCLLLVPGSAELQ